MDTHAFTTPVVFFVFNRPDLTRAVFEAIAGVRPQRLLVVADGPRSGVEDEPATCEIVRAIALNVTWPCDVATSVSDVNLGARQRITSGLNWAFSLVDEAIILEDDCLPDASFFPFCAAMLERYRGDSRFAMVTGNNFVGHAAPNRYSYYFSRMTYTWGWATWKSAWARYDQKLTCWPEVRQSGLLSEVFEDPDYVKYWTAHFDATFDAPESVSWWDFQWFYTNLINNAMTITPRVNLVTNMGFGSSATHTSGPGDGLVVAASRLNPPYLHPPAFFILQSIDRLSKEIYLPKPFTQRRVKTLLRSAGKALGFQR